MAKNAIFLYEFFEEPCRIKLIKALELPPLCDGGRLNFAHCLSEQNLTVYRTSHPAPSTTGRLPPRFPFRHNAADGIACFVLGVSLEEIPGASVTIAIVVHRRALVALASAASESAATTATTATTATASSSTAVASADADADADEQQEPERQPVPWDSWGPSVTRCLEVPYWRRCRGPTGQRWGMLAHDELVLHDFNPHNVRRAAAQLLSDEVPASAPPPPPTTTTTTTTGGVLRRHENGNRTRVVSSPTLLTAGLCFRDDVTSNLPYVETRAVYTSPSRWENVLTDDERLLGLYFKVCVFPSPPTRVHK